VARGNGASGYAAQGDGELQACLGCRALWNADHGLLAFSRGNLLVAGSHCAALSNMKSSFAVRNGAKLTAQDHCVSARNIYAQFVALDEGSELLLSEGCVANEGSRPLAPLGFGGRLIMLPRAAEPPGVKKEEGEEPEEMDLVTGEGNDGACCAAGCQGASGWPAGG
jgi:hypothetical protein